MKIAYVDLDGTLYRTSELKLLIVKEISSGIAEALSAGLDEIYEDVSGCFKNRHNISVFDFARQMAKKYKVSEEKIIDRLENILKNSSNLLYNDSIDFLEKLKESGYETYILTFSRGYDNDYQMLKLTGSGISKLVDGVFICSKDKGELNLDYKNGIFVDDNPKQLASLFNAGVSEDRLFRIKRKNEKYSSVEITEFLPKEYDTLENMEI